MSLGGCSPLSIVLILFWMQSLPMVLMALTVSLYPSASRGCRYCRGIKIMANVVASFHCASKFVIGSSQMISLSKHSWRKFILIKWHSLIMLLCLTSLQWNLRIKDTLGAELLSFFRRLSSGGRFKPICIL